MPLKGKIVLAVLTTVALLHLLVHLRRYFPKPIERALDALKLWWQGAAKKIAHGQTVALLFLVYWTGIALTVLIARASRRDFLRLKGKAEWLPRKKKKDTIETLKRQF